MFYYILGNKVKYLNLDLKLTFIISFDNYKYKYNIRFKS